MRNSETARCEPIAVSFPPNCGPDRDTDTPLSGPLFSFRDLTGEGPHKLRDVDWAAVSRGDIL